MSDINTSGAKSHEDIKPPQRDPPEVLHSVQWALRTRQECQRRLQGSRCQVIGGKPDSGGPNKRLYYGDQDYLTKYCGRTFESQRLISP